MSNLIDAHTLYQQLSEYRVFDAGIVKPGSKGPYSPPAVIQTAQRFDISGALSCPESRFPNMMCSVEQFQAEMRQQGLKHTDKVAVYDDKGLFSAARAWWMLKSMGFEQVQILDGGLPYWQKHGYPTQTYYAFAEQAGDFTAAPIAGYFIDKTQIHDALNNPSVCILDARGAKRFSGLDPEPRQDMRSGHIPNAKNLPYSSVVTEEGLLKPRGLLKQMLSECGVTEEKTLYFSCGSGITACILALIAQECGYHDLHVYDGSWSEWGRIL